MGGGWAIDKPFVFSAEDGESTWLDGPFEVAAGVAEGNVGSGAGGSVCERCTSTGSQPPGACLTFEASMPRRRGMEGPVRSTSRIPTE